jgi:hypothetical protein
MVSFIWSCTHGSTSKAETETIQTH